MGFGRWLKYCWMVLSGSSDGRICPRCGVDLRIPEAWCKECREHNGGADWLLTSCHDTYIASCIGTELRETMAKEESDRDRRVIRDGDWL